MPTVRAAPIYVPKLKINGVGLAALDVFEAALDYWDRFFKKYEL
jgi:hypothetical protein